LKQTDEKSLIEQAQNHDTLAMEELIIHYKPLVASIARQYFLLGGGTDDLIQEGMIGLFQAIQMYQTNSAASFKTFATLCVKRKVQTVVKNANRQKNKMLNFFLTINNQGVVVTDTSEEQENDSEENETGIYITSKLLNPENAMISRESVEYIKTQIENKLTILEKDVLQSFILGKSYGDIATEFNISKKAVDNILFKVRRKLAFLKEE